MCQAGGGPEQPAGVTGALAMLDRALDALAGADAASLPTGVQADTLRALERAQSRHTAVRARILAAFVTQDGCTADGQGTAKAWLRWQTRVTSTAAAASVGWARRLDQHPGIAAALADGDLSQSWAKAICAWTDRLPEDRRADADQILADAARGGADLTDLAGLAEEMYRRTVSPDADPGDGFGDRYLNVGLTWRGAGRVDGDLTPGCAAALTAVVEALGKKAGPEDTRSAAQRRHDALAEACQRLIAAGMVPARAGQPTQVLVHMTLSQLRDLPGAAEAEEQWAAARASEPGWLTGPEADAAACDATVIPVVSGRPDDAALDRLAGEFLAGGDAAKAAAAGPGDAGRIRPLAEVSRRRLRRALLGLAAETLSGPGGLAAWLRTGLAIPGLTSPSLPLDIGTATDLIPAHLRRAAMTRHQCCAFPGCEQPASICHLHHLVPRRNGGQTTLRNLVPLCGFHHLIAIHTWGWHLTLHPDGTTTATSPDGTRTLHSHGPPAQAA